jgi:hypothetical protein
MLLQEGFANAQQGKISATKCSEKERIISYAQDIEHILYNIILGDDDGPAQWALPYDQDKKNDRSDLF